MIRMYWTSASYQRPMSSADVVKCEIEESRPYFADQTEVIECKIGKITDVICALVEVLTDDQQRELIEKIAFDVEELK